MLAVKILPRKTFSVHHPTFKEKVKVSHSLKEALEKFFDCYRSRVTESISELKILPNIDKDSSVYIISKYAKDVADGLKYINNPSYREKKNFLYQKTWFSYNIKMKILLN